LKEVNFTLFFKYINTQKRKAHFYLTILTIYNNNKMILKELDLKEK